MEKEEQDDKDFLKEFFLQKEDEEEKSEE